DEREQDRPAVRVERQGGRGPAGEERREDGGERLAALDARRQPESGPWDGRRVRRATQRVGEVAGRGPPGRVRRQRAVDEPQEPLRQIGAERTERPRAGVASPPASRSGEMYASVPGTSPASVSVSASAICASPKSSTRAETRSPSVRRTFDGLTSRCRIPAACACARPSHTCAQASIAWSSFSSPARSASRYGWPGTNSYAM